MPGSSRLRACGEPGCPNLSTTGRCETHRRTARAVQDAKRGTFRQRGYDHEYDRNRAVVLREETHCGICSELVDKTLPGTDRRGPSVDHIIARVNGGTNARENLRLVHATCNSSTGGATRSSNGQPAETPQPARAYRHGSVGIQ